VLADYGGTITSALAKNVIRKLTRDLFTAAILCVILQFKHVHLSTHV